MNLSCILSIITLGAFELLKAPSVYVFAFLCHMLMNNIKQKILRYMQGRYISYGYDAYTRFLLILWLIFLVFTSFMRGNQFFNFIIKILPTLLFVYIYFRLFSKNISARYNENEAYLKVKRKLLKNVLTFKENIEMKKSYHIYRCPSCNQKIRIPKGKGRIEVSCPKCGNKFLKVS